MSDYPYNYLGYPKDYTSPWIFPLPSEKERDRRWDTIRRSMVKNNLDCLIISAPFGYMCSIDPNLCYISNYVPFINTNTYLIFPLEEEPQLGLTSGLGPQYFHCAYETSWIRDIVAIPNPGEGLLRKIRQLKLDKGRLGIVGLNQCIFPALYYNLLISNFSSATLIDATKALCEAMDEVSRSSEEELGFLRKACDILDLSFEAVAEALKPGVSELELWAAAEHTIIKNGGWGAHFMIGTSGSNTTFMRAPGSHRTISSGDVVMFEINSVYGGISPQISYALSLRRPAPQLETMFKFCQELYNYSLSELENNKTFLTIETDIVKQIHQAGYQPLTPQIHRFNLSGVMPMNKTPEPGDYFTVHPNICDKDYTTGAKFGDVIRITSDGKVERMNRTPAQLNII